MAFCVATCGTTSACAENTAALLPTSETPGNYLRVRGEYTKAAIDRGTKGELPPRARRILFEGVPGGFNNGTTSACAENTLEWSDLPDFNGNYLRVRGEYKPT